MDFEVTPMPVTQTGRKLLTSDEIVAKASDCQAVQCQNCGGNGFLLVDLLCPVCQGSGAVLVPKPREVTGRSMLGWAAFCLVLAGLILWGMFRP